MEKFRHLKPPKPRPGALNGPLSTSRLYAGRCLWPSLFCYWPLTDPLSPSVFPSWTLSVSPQAWPALGSLRAVVCSEKDRER